MSQSNINDELLPNNKQNNEIFFKLIEKVGTFGKYQLTLFITLCVIGLYTGSVIQMTPFLFY